MSQQNLGNVAPPYNPEEARARRVREYVIWGCVAVILASAIALSPTLASAELTKTWCNFRPHVEGRPLVGASSLPGLFLATGHHRNGILLAKQTAEDCASAILS